MDPVSNPRTRSAPAGNRRLWSAATGHVRIGRSRSTGSRLAALLSLSSSLGSGQAELVALCAIAHAAAQDDWRVLFAFAGLPSLPRVLAEAKSYAERINYEKTEELRGTAASEALTKPATDDGVEWDEPAAALIVKENAGYPYFLQQFGQDTWNAATGPKITYDDARVGAANGRAALDSGLPGPVGTGHPGPSRTTCRRWPKTETKEAPQVKSRAAWDGGRPVSARSGRT